MMPIRLKRNSLFISGHGLFHIPCGISLRKDGFAVHGGGGAKYIYLPIAQRNAGDWIDAIDKALGELESMRPHLLTRRKLKDHDGENYPGAYDQYVSPKGIVLPPRSFNPVDGSYTYHHTYGEALSHRIKMENMYLDKYRFMGTSVEPAI